MTNSSKVLMFFTIVLTSTIYLGINIPFFSTYVSNYFNIGEALSLIITFFASIIIFAFIFLIIIELFFFKEIEEGVA